MRRLCHACRQLITAIQSSLASFGSTGNYGYTDRVGLQYAVNPQVNTYVNYSHGYRRPARNVFFDITAVATNAVKPEASNDYELGLKSRWRGGRLQAKVAVYLTNFDNYQVNFADVVDGALITRLINAGTVYAKGIGADQAARPLENLTLTAALASTDAHVDRFNCPANAEPDP